MDRAARNNAMKLAEALRILRATDPAAPEYPVSLVMGSTPEPLSHLLAAHIQQALHGQRITLRTGRFGDLAGNLARHLEDGYGPAVALLEWSDMDPRLGIRQASAWGRDVVGDILATVDRYLEHLGSLLEQTAPGKPVILAPPSLPLPPVFPAPPFQLSVLDAALQERLFRFLARCAALEPVRTLSLDNLAAISPAERLDVKSWLQAGSPYRLGYASILAERLAKLLIPTAPAKGIITDLDDTLWAGILGEEGPSQVWWDLEHHAAGHGVYQQFLQSLAGEGVLLAVASKNDPSLVEEAFRRPDLLLRADSIFPIEAHWKPKAESIARILAAWNIGPESVVFLDDSALEVAAAQAAFPGMDCRQFPTQDPDALWSLLSELAERFGKPARREEDKIRLQSLRITAELRELQSTGYSQDDILRASEGVLTLAKLTSPPDPRSIELINKTNQFNLNGRRYTESDWTQFLEMDGSSAWMASYRDKFGPLGKIAVLGGRKQDHQLEIDVWVMSCRAFSRRIEHAILDFLFKREDVDEIVLRFRSTERNGPLREFLEQLIAKQPEGQLSLVRSEFESQKPAIHLSIESSL
jgi:FkbH-like protein